MSHVQQLAAKDTGGVPILYPMLTPLNYTVWAIKTEAVLDAQGVWEAVEPAEGTQVDAKKDKKARAYILQCIPEDILLQIVKNKTAKEIWESIKTRYLGSERVKKARVQTLKSEFDALRMTETDTIDEFAGKLSAMTSKFSTLGVALEDSSLVKKLLDSVPDKYFPIVPGIEQFHDLETMPFEEAIGRMKAYEERIARRCVNTNNTEGQLLLTHAEWKARQKRNNGDNSLGNKGRGSNDHYRGKWRGRGRGRGRGTSRHNSAGGTYNTGSGTRDKSHIRCFACDKMGHYASECRSKGRDDEAHLTCATDEEPALMMTISQEGTHTRRVGEYAVLLSDERLLPETYCNDKDGESKDVWYLDNGASNHMTGHREKFQELDEGVTGKVRFGDGSTIQIMGKGTVVFECKNGDHKALQEVYYIPKLCSNIISLGQMTEDGNKVQMAGDTMKVTDNSGKLVMSVKRNQSRLYKITLKTSKQVCLQTSLDDPAWLWHARLGHVNFHDLKVMGEKKLAVGVPLLSRPNKFCETCVISKHVRSPFPNQANFRAEKPLKLLHADVCGPISPDTLAGNKFFLLIVDDFTRWMWVYVLTAKSDSFQAFKKFKSLMENKTGYKIGTLRTDRGGEFLSTEFTQFCQKEGIERHLTAPYTPQQNGIVERHNRTVMAMTRSLLRSTHLPARFWGEAVRHAVYLLNRLPTRVLGNRTPFEALMGRRPHLTHLRVFGCVAYVKNTTPHLKKLDDRSSPMNLEWTWKEVFNNNKGIPEFTILDAIYSDETNVVMNEETGAENVTPPAVAETPTGEEASSSTNSPNIHEATSPQVTNTPVRFRSLVDIYANTEEIVDIEEEYSAPYLLMLQFMEQWKDLQASPPAVDLVNGRYAYILFNVCFVSERMSRKGTTLRERAFHGPARPTFLNNLVAMILPATPCLKIAWQHSDHVADMPHGGIRTSTVRDGKQTGWSKKQKPEQVTFDHADDFINIVWRHCKPVDQSKLDMNREIPMEKGENITSPKLTFTLTSECCEANIKRPNPVQPRFVLCLEVSLSKVL
ncbi:hypothetical protein GQ457_10G006770 [Hibiscus cannabinus]